MDMFDVCSNIFVCQKLYTFGTHRGINIRAPYFNRKNNTDETLEISQCVMVSLYYFLLLSKFTATSYVEVSRYLMCMV